MTTYYKKSSDVPSKILCDRLTVLASAVTDGPVAISREFGMRIPCEVDYDADMILAEAGERIKELELKLIKASDVLKVLGKTDEI